MAYTVQEFLALDLSKRSSGPICVLCKKQIAESSLNDARRIPAGKAHEDCYFNELGGITEQHPVGLPCR
ncbi:hypothetical protein KBC59_02195 [Patescibacteria group bacterium]|jgi:hypothetical protein|nr:hypothetical protein [Patescibacteria group bacterium]